MFSMLRDPSLTSTLTLVVCLSFLAAACTRPTEKEDRAKNTEIRVSDSNLDTADPRIAADREGNIYALFVEHAADKGADLYLQKFDPGLHRTGKKVRVNPDPGSVKSWAGDAPTIVVGADKRIFVGWTIRTAGGGTNLVISTSLDAGRSFADPVKVNDDEAPASHGMHSLAVDNNGIIFAAWLDERNIPRHVGAADHKSAGSLDAPEPNSEVFFASSTDGGTTFSKNQRIASDVCPCCKTAILAPNDGGIYISWRQVLEGDYRHIAVASSADGGKTFSPRSIVSDDRWQISACPVSGAAMYAGPDRELSVAWFTAGDAGQAGYYTAKTTGGGQQFGQRLYVGGEGVSGTPTIVDTNSGPVLVMAGQDEKLTLAKISDQGGSYDVESGVLQGSNPTATFANGSIYLAFVRSENKTRSVWIAKR